MTLIDWLNRVSLLVVTQGCLNVYALVVSLSDQVAILDQSDNFTMEIPRDPIMHHMVSW